MTIIEMYGGAYGEQGDTILLAGADLMPDGAARPWSNRRAVREARQLIAARKLQLVAISDRGEIVWADSAATRDMYPYVGTLPASRRSGGPGNVIASSGVRCPWDTRRYKIIPYASADA